MQRMLINTLTYYVKKNTLMYLNMNQFVS